MTLRAKLELAAAIVAAIAAVLGFRSWLLEHDLRMKTQATVESQQKILDQSTDQAKQLSAARAKADEQTAAQIDAMKAAVAKIQTPAQIAQWLPKQIPGAPAPIEARLPASTPENPTPDAVVTVPQEDLPILRDQVEACQECTVKLANAVADGVSKDQQLKTAGEALSAAENQRDAYKAALKGGTFWTRTKKAAKFLAIGGAIGGGLVCASGHCK